MQKKQTPFMLIAVIAVVMMIALFLNATGGIGRFMADAEARKQEKAKEFKAPDASTDEAQKNKANLATALKRSNMKEPGMENPALAATGNPASPTIFIEKNERYKPVENPTSTAAQWWLEDSQAKENSDSVRKERGF